MILFNHFSATCSVDSKPRCCKSEVNGVHNSWCSLGQSPFCNHPPLEHVFVGFDATLCLIHYNVPLKVI